MAKVLLSMTFKRVAAVLAVCAALGLTAGAGWEKAPPVTDKLAFMSYRDGNWEIYIMDADGANQANLTNTAIDEMNPHFAPDGGQILFQSEGALYVMDPGGEDRQALPAEGLHVFGGRFSWDGTRIVFSASPREQGQPPAREGQSPGERRAPGEGQPPPPPETPQGQAQIYVMNADGSGLGRLTHSRFDDTWPCFSPDGKKIVFERRVAPQSVEEKEDWAAIFIMDADGANERQLTDGTRLDRAPCFSPDGTKIVFQRWGTPALGTSQIFIMNVDGTNQVNLTRNDYDNAAPIFSYEGTKIAFHSNMHGRGPDFDIYVANADGSGTTRLTSTSGFDWNPTFSPARQEP